MGSLGAGGTAAGVSQTSATVVGSRAAGLTRLVRRIDDGPGVLWKALLPAAGLAALTWFATAPFAANDIEANVERGVQAQLQARGFGWVAMKVSGQEVLLAGTPPAPGAGEAALEAARAATCATWAGPQICAVTVLGAFDAPRTAGAAGTAAAPDAASARPAAPATSAATAAQPPPAVTEGAARACEASFAELLAGARLEFASGTSAIDARSAPLLDRLAAAAGNCPGRVRIEGHTDNVGDAAANQRLSEARAAAVRAALASRGVNLERLDAAGFGDTRPLADNGSDAGRAANRRIEFKALP